MGIFMGYPSNVKGYIIYDMKLHKFIITRNVRFFENEIPFHKYKANSSSQLMPFQNNDEDYGSCDEYQIEHIQDCDRHKKKSQNSRILEENPPIISNSSSFDNQVETTISKSSLTTTINVDNELGERNANKEINCENRFEMLREDPTTQTEQEIARTQRG